MSVVRNPLMNPWKDASRSISGSDAQVAFYAKCIADEGLTAGNPANSATITVAGDLVTFQIAEAAGSLANDTGIDYTSNSGSAGTATLADTNFNTIQDMINVVNGVGVGQTAFRRWKAVLGDRIPSYAITSGDLLARTATQALLGPGDVGVSVFLDSSALAIADEIGLAIGTSGGARDGATSQGFPQYFEDIPGSSTTASVNTPVRSSALQSRKYNEAIVARKQYRITGWSFAGDYDTTMPITITDIDGNVLWSETSTAGSAITFQDRSESPIIGPVGSPLFFLISGTGTYADGRLSVRAEERFV